MAKNQETPLGQLLIRKKICNLQQVREALGKQVELRQRNENCPLGKILIDSGKLDEETLLETLSEMGALQLHCPVCRTNRMVASYKRNTIHPCPRCHEPLIYRGQGQVESEHAPGGVDEAPAPVPPRKGGSVRVGKTLVTNLAAAGIPAEDLPRSPADLSKSYEGMVLGGCKIESKVA
ncbi:MAG TPA: hypothetical protein VMT52_13055, partial [Planctomycetota bacterium]|nr:hypothetical protein [Planctomycetota bacterium]